MKKILMRVFLTACLIVPSITIHAGGSEMSSKDRKFVRAAAEDSLTVERLGQMANQQSQNPGVKQLAQKLSRDYARADEQLRALGQTLAISTPKQLNRRASRKINKLEGLSGAEFDLVALRELVKAEQTYLLKVQDEAAKGINPDLKQFATTTLPPLQDDIYEVVRLQSDLNVTASTANGSANHGQPLGAQP